jgi:hypothetical protein
MALVAESYLVCRIGHAKFARPQQLQGLFDAAFQDKL